MAEGAGILVLESLSHALRRDARIYGEVIGYGASSDAYHMVATHPEGIGPYLAMRAALREAGIVPESDEMRSLTPMQQARNLGIEIGNSGDQTPFWRSSLQYSGNCE